MNRAVCQSVNCFVFGMFFLFFVINLLKRCWLAIVS